MAWWGERLHSKCISLRPSLTKMKCIKTCLSFILCISRVIHGTFIHGLHAKHKRCCWPCSELFHTKWTTSDMWDPWEFPENAWRCKNAKWYNGDDNATMPSSMARLVYLIRSLMILLMQTLSGSIVGRKSMLTRAFWIKPTHVSKSELGVDLICTKYGNQIKT